MSNCPPKIVVPRTTNMSSAMLVSKKLVYTTGTLRGTTGPTGATGATGANGATGATGASSNVTAASPAFVQYGSVVVSGTILARASSSFSGFFPTAFKTPPTVVCTVSGVAGMSVSLLSVTQSGFTGYVTNTTSVPYGYDGAVQYFAICSS